jgi:2-(1,2-epoxy-1,2-dihydrophenyl)acetyl-CoA isomerase
MCSLAIERSAVLNGNGRVEPAEQVIYQLIDGVAVITLNRPGRLNALTDAMMDELLPAACRRAEADDRVRVVVLTGADGNFCSGGDIQERISGVRARLTTRLEGLQRDLGSFVLPLSRITKPTIAALDGVTAGGGLALALACDLRTATENVRIIAPFIRRGLVPDGGVSQTLVAAVGYAAAFDIALTGRAVTGGEALRLGLAQRLWSAESWWAETMRLAAALAAMPCQASLLTKRALRAAAGHDPARALVTESWFQSICMRDPDFDEGVASFLEKRPPNFHQS